MKKIVMLFSLVAFIMAFTVNASAQSNPGSQKGTTEKVCTQKDTQSPAKSCCSKSATAGTKSDCAKTCSKPCDHSKKVECKESAPKTDAVPVPKAK
jgi:hypothetical protein